MYMRACMYDYNDKDHIISQFQINCQKDTNTQRDDDTTTLTYPLSDTMDSFLKNEKASTSNEYLTASMISSLVHEQLYCLQSISLALSHQPSENQAGIIHI